MFANLCVCHNGRTLLQLLVGNKTSVVIRMSNLLCKLQFKQNPRCLSSFPSQILKSLKVSSFIKKYETKPSFLVWNLQRCVYQTEKFPLTLLNPRLMGTTNFSTFTAGDIYYQNFLRPSKCTLFSHSNFSSKDDEATSLHGRFSSLQAKKRVQKKKKTILTETEQTAKHIKGFEPMARPKFLTFDPHLSIPDIPVFKPVPHEWLVVAYATAEEYSLESLLDSLTHQGLYVKASVNEDSPDVLHMIPTYRVDGERRDIFFFRDGVVVFWNVSELERHNVMRFLHPSETSRYQDDLVEEESESLSYSYGDEHSKTRLIRNRILLCPDPAVPMDLERYAFSNALAMSVKLGIWEVSLESYIDSIEYITEELSKTGHVMLNQQQVLQKMGQLFALRHLINLSSDLLDTPDFYWEHDNLEVLYLKMCQNLNISKRTHVLNTKLSHCVELMELLKSRLTEKHSARLEWIIIILIMVEVLFELLHYADKIF